MDVVSRNVSAGMAHRAVPTESEAEICMCKVNVCHSITLLKMILNFTLKDEEVGRDRTRMEVVG